MKITKLVSSAISSWENRKAKAVANIKRLGLANLRPLLGKAFDAIITADAKELGKLKSVRQKRKAESATRIPNAKRQAIIIDLTRSP